MRVSVLFSVPSGFSVTVVSVVVILPVGLTCVVSVRETVRAHPAVRHDTPIINILANVINLVALIFFIFFVICFIL